MIDPHREAERLMGEADAADAAGDERAARQLLIQAARLEAEAFATTPIDRPKTRGVLGLSSVALLRDGGDSGAATRQAHLILAHDGLPDDVRYEIEMLLDELRTATLAGLSPHREGLQWALRGGRVGFGIARLETVDLKIQQIQALAWRTYEFLGGLSFRTNQTPTAEVRSAVDLMVGQPPWPAALSSPFMWVTSN